MLKKAPIEEQQEILVCTINAW